MRRLTALPLMAALCAAALVLRVLTHTLLIVRTLALVVLELALAQVLNRRVDVILAMSGIVRWVEPERAHE